VKGDLPGELIFRWFALRAMKTLSIFVFALFLPVVNAQSNQNVDRAHVYQACAGTALLSQAQKSSGIQDFS
jgi:hypothetical protein